MNLPEGVKVTVTPDTDEDRWGDRRGLIKVVVEDEDNRWTSHCNTERETRRKIKKGVKYITGLARLQREFH